MMSNSKIYRKQNFGLWKKFYLLLVVMPGIVAMACNTEGGEEEGVIRAAIAGAENPDPIYYEGNTKCGDLQMGYDVEFKIEDYELNTDKKWWEHTFWLDYKGDSYPFVFEFKTDGKRISWKSGDIGVSAVIVKGGPDSHVYVYDPPGYEGSRQLSPKNRGGNLPDISHFSFCLDFKLSVDKTAEGIHEKEFEWEIDKKIGDGDLRVASLNLVLSSGQWYEVPYYVALTRTEVAESFVATGEITIRNMWPFPAEIESVVDTLEGMNDPVELMNCMLNESNVDELAGLMLKHGDMITCEYEVVLSGADELLNTVAVETTEGSIVDGAVATAIVNFGDPVLHDECVTLTDSMFSWSKEICETRIEEYMYMLEAPECGTTPTSINNIASIITNERGVTLQSSASVVVTVAECEVGCTLTQGYWKTHSEYGPAPYDDTWALLDNGADEPFFNSGMSYHDILWTPPKKGNAYLILAHQWIAAAMNKLNDAGMSAAIMLVYDDAMEKLAAAEEDDFSGPTRGEYAQELKALAGMLASYNEGEYGTGHCDESGDSEPDF